MTYLPPPTSLQVKDLQSGNEGKVTTHGAQIMAELTRLAGGTFDGSALSDIFWKPVVVGSGYATVSNGVVRVGTGTVANSAMSLESVRVARYLTGNSNEFLAGARFSNTGAVNQVKRLGVFDAQNGYFIEQRDGAIRLMSRKGGVDTPISHTSFSVPAAFIHDTRYHSYLIEYGANKVVFFQDGKMFHWLVSDVSVLTATMHLKIGFEVLNLNGAAGDHAIEIRTASVSREGKAISRPIYHLIPNIQVAGRSLKAAPSTLQKVLIGTRGANNSYIDLFDSPTAGTNQVARIDTTVLPACLDCDIDFYSGLSYSCTASPGYITLIFD